MVLWYTHTFTASLLINLNGQLGFVIEIACSIHDLRSKSLLIVTYHYKYFEHTHLNHYANTCVCLRK